MNCPQDIISAHYARSGRKFSISYNPGVLVNMVMYYSKSQHSPQDFKLFTFSWRLGSIAQYLGRRVNP